MQEIIKFHKGRKYVCRPNKSGMFYITWSESGRSKRQSTGTRDVHEAQAFFDEYVGLIAVPKMSVLTIDDLWQRKYPNPSSRYADAWKSLQPHFGHLTVSQVTQDVQDDYAEKRPIAASTLRLELSLIRAAINHGVRKRVVDPKDVPVWDELPDQSPPRDRWLSDEEASRLIEAAKINRRVYLFCVLALETGARRTAIQDLTWARVDLKQGVIHYQEPGAPQTRKRNASVPISKRLRPVLTEAQKTREGPFVIGAGTRINQPLQRIAEGAGIEGVTPHVLRHTAATRMARAGVPIFHIAKVLGNTVDVVERVYAKWQPEMLQGAVDAISGE